MHEEYPRVLIVAVWFGALPSWFPQWVTSCQFNTEVSWLLYTDAEVNIVDIPRNLHVVRGSMREFAERLEAASGQSIALQSAYKTNDFKPLYWTLCDLVPGPWDFWGHCDLDMIFGHIPTFLTPELLRTYDKVFGVGHFSVYRNTPPINNFYSRPNPLVNFRSVLADPAPRAFDEHNGVNSTWHLHKGRFWEDEEAIIDLDPQYPALRRISTTTSAKNYRSQVFGFDRGYVFRVHVSGRRLVAKQFMYMHFQKRKFTLPPLPVDTNAFWITSAGFVAADGNPLTAARVKAINSGPVLPSPSDIAYRLRRRLRLLRWKLELRG